MPEELNDIEKARLDLLLREYSIFNGRVNTLMLRMTAVPAALLAYFLPAVFGSGLKFDETQLVALSLVCPACVFLVFQISSQMMVYKEHMTHLARQIRELNGRLQMQWDLIYYSLIYQACGRGTRKKSVISVGGGTAYLLALLVCSFLAWKGFWLLYDHSVFLSAGHLALVVALVLGGPVLLLKVRTNLRGAYAEIVF